MSNLLRFLIQSLSAILVCTQFAIIRGERNGRGAGTEASPYQRNATKGGRRWSQYLPHRVFVCSSNLVAGVSKKEGRNESHSSRLLHLAFIEKTRQTSRPATQARIERDVFTSFPAFPSVPGSEERLDGKLSE